MRVLVTGGAGYVGSHVARALVRHGYDVVVYDDFSTGHRFLVDGFEVVAADVNDSLSLAEALKGKDAVLHFAAHTNVAESVKNPRPYFSNNVQSGLALLDSILKSGVRKIVFSSSCAVYGVPQRIPITEEAPRNPVNPYGVSKLFFEQALEAYDAAYGLKSAILRYFNAAGADESGEIGEAHNPETHLIPRALRVAAGIDGELEIYGSDYETTDGTCIRDYIHVSDLAVAHVLALEYLSGDQSIVLNLGTGEGFSNKEVVKTVERVTGRIIPLRYRARRVGDPPVLVADPARARTLLKWQSQRSLPEIVSSAWKWHQRQMLQAGAKHHGATRVL